MKRKTTDFDKFICFTVVVILAIAALSMVGCIGETTEVARGRARMVSSWSGSSYEVIIMIDRDKSGKERAWAISPGSKQCINLIWAKDLLNLK